VALENTNGVGRSRRGKKRSDKTAKKGRRRSSLKSRKLTEGNKNEGQERSHAGVWDDDLKTPGRPQWGGKERAKTRGFKLDSQSWGSEGGEEDESIRKIVGISRRKSTLGGSRRR